MKELDKLIKDLKQLGVTLKSLLMALFFKAPEKGRGRRGTSKKLDSQVLQPNLKMFVICLIAGIGIGMLLGKNEGNPFEKFFSVGRLIFAKTIHVPGKQPDGAFVFADFEQSEDLKAWAVGGAEIELSPRFAAKGKQSARLHYRGGGQISTVYISDYFESRKGLDDWTAYEFLSYYFYNPRKETERLILQVKDKRGNRYKENIHIPGGQGKVFTTKVERIAGSINVRDIDSLQFFRWEPRQDRELYLDDVKLIPAGHVETPDAVTHKQIIETADRPVNQVDFGFDHKKASWIINYPNALGQVVRIPFIVKNETRGSCTACPVEGGVPIPQGELFDENNVHVKNSAHQLIPFHRSVLGKWPDGSIKWLRVSFQADLAPQQGGGYFLEYGPNIKPPVISDKLYTENHHSLTVNTGPLEVTLSKRRFYLFESVKQDKNADGEFTDDEILIENAPLQLKFNDTLYYAHLDNQSYKAVVESDSPERLVVKAEGWFQSQNNNRFSKLVVRYYFYKGSPRVKVAHTFIYTGYPENTYYDKYKGLNLPDNEMIQSMEIVLPFRNFGDEATRVTLGTHESAPVQFMTSAKMDLKQLSWSEFLLDNDKKPLAIQGNLGGWIDVNEAHGGVAVSLRDFRENFPKAYELDAKKHELKIELWPEEAGPLDLSTTSNALGPEARARGSAFGLAKTHELQFYFHTGDSPAAEISHAAESFKEPLIIRTNPYWMEATGVFGALFPVTPKYRSQEKMLDGLFEWANRQPKDFKWYGMLNFGDTLTWWQPEFNSWHPIGRWGWYNNEGVGTHTGALMQFVRSGEWKYFEFGGNLSRHIMDIDTVHFNTIAHDSRLKNLLSDEVSQVGSMHRHNGDHWGGRNEESTHTNVIGLLYYYYLTGDERTLDVIHEVGSFFLKEPFTYTDHPDMAAHRALANALWGDVLLYELTGDDKYKHGADRIIEMYLAGQQSDGSFLEFYNPLQQTWGGKKHRLYMEGYLVGALIAYHQLTQDEEVKEMYLSLVDFLGGSAEIIHGNAYAYFITSDARYLDKISRGLDLLVRKRIVSHDSLEDGLIYNKRIYHRPMTFLYTAPYAFGALEASARQDAH